MFDWNDLRYVLAIARGGSLAAAARALEVNHSTVFRRLNAFEEQLGVRVFERLPEGYALTAAGEEIRRHAEAVENSVHELERTVVGQDYRLSGEIRITTAPNLATDYLAGYVARFRRSHPEIRVEIAAGDHDFDLARREADVALRATTRPPEFLVGRKVCALPWYAFAGDSYLAERRAPRDMSELHRHALIGADHAFQRIGIFAWQRQQFAPESLVARANDLNTMRALALAGVGIAFLPADQVAPGLHRLFPIEPAFHGELWLLTHPDLRQVARIKAFMDHLLQCLRDDPRLAEFVVAAPSPAPAERSTTSAPVPPPRTRTPR